MFKSKLGYPVQYGTWMKAAGAIGLCISCFVFLCKLIGFKAVAAIVGVCALIVIVVIIGEMDSPKARLIKGISLAAFFLFAVVFIFLQTGYLLLVVMLAFGALFSPLLFTQGAAKVQEPDAFLDPEYKGLSGNIWTRKDENS